MDLKQRAAALREKSAKAFEDAKALKDEFAKFEGDVPSDKMEAFNRAIDESTRAAQQAQELDRQAQALAALEEAHTKPVTGLPAAGISRETQATAERRQEAHKRAFKLWAANDRDECRRVLLDGGFSSQEAHALISGDDAKGGFLVPDDVRAQVIERRAANAVMRGLAQVVPTSRDVLVYPRIAANAGTYPTVYQSGFTGDWDTEQGSTTETSGTVTVKTQQNQPTAEMVRIQVHNWIPNPVVVSMTLIEDSAAPLETILARHIASTAALDEDYVCITGSGVNHPSGIINNSSITTVASGASANVTYGGLLDLIYGLPAQYAQGATLLMKRSTMGEILALETGTGTDLVFKNTTVGPNNLLGYPVVFSDFMPACTTGSNKAIVFGNFQDGYVIADRQDLRVTRLNERYHPNVGFSPVARMGGAVVLPEAFRLLNISAS